MIKIAIATVLDQAGLFLRSFRYLGPNLGKTPPTDVQWLSGGLPKHWGLRLTYAGVAKEQSAAVHEMMNLR